MALNVVAAVASAVLLAGCFGGGGDDDGPPPATAEVPASASQSSAGFIAYLQELVASAADTLEPVDASGLTAPTDDASEPTVVN